MKLLKSAIIIASLISGLFMSCSKDDDNTPDPAPPAAGIEGLYDGVYGFGSDSPDMEYTLKFKSNGLIQEIGQASGSATGEGTYSLNGNHLTAKYQMLFAPYSDYYIDATYDANTKTLTGTWGYENATDGGKFSVHKE